MQKIDWTIKKISIIRQFVNDARVAQLVEQRTENPRVGGSIPSPSTIKNSPQGEFFVFKPSRD